jgi:hypothetical protein
MNTAVATRHPLQAPSLKIPWTLSPSSLPASSSMSDSSNQQHVAPGTPPPTSIDTDSPFYLSPKTPKAEVARSKSQSRRTLGNWQLGKTIGQGSMGRVRLGFNITTGEQVRLLFLSKAMSDNLEGRSQDHSSNTARICTWPVTPY